VYFKNISEGHSDRKADRQKADRKKDSERDRKT
jgi:hypothetical protein